MLFQHFSKGQETQDAKDWLQAMHVWSPYVSIYSKKLPAPCASTRTGSGIVAICIGFVVEDGHEIQQVQGFLSSKDASPVFPSKLQHTTLLPSHPHCPFEKILMSPPSPSVLIVFQMLLDVISEVTASKHWTGTPHDMSIPQACHPSNFPSGLPGACIHRSRKTNHIRICQVEVTSGSRAINEALWSLGSDGKLQKYMN